MDQLSVAFTAPALSMAVPVTSNNLPRQPRPTGTVIGSPVSLTSVPRAKPSVGAMERHLIQLLPMCPCTSSTSFPLAVSISRALNIFGNSSGGNSTSMTVPMICTILPLAIKTSVFPQTPLISG